MLAAQPAPSPSPNQHQRQKSTGRHQIVTGQLSLMITSGQPPPPIWQIYGHLWRALLLGQDLPANAALTGDLLAGGACVTNSFFAATDFCLLKARIGLPSLP